MIVFPRTGAFFSYVRLLVSLFGAAAALMHRTVFFFRSVDRRLGVDLDLGNARDTSVPCLSVPLVFGL